MSEKLTRRGLLGWLGIGALAKDVPIRLPVPPPSLSTPSSSWLKSQYGVGQCYPLCSITTGSWPAFCTVMSKDGG